MKYGIHVLALAMFAAATCSINNVRAQEPTDDQLKTIKGFGDPTKVDEKHKDALTMEVKVGQNQKKTVKANPFDSKIKGVGKVTLGKTTTGMKIDGLDVIASADGLDGFATTKQVEVYVMNWDKDKGEFEAPVLHPGGTKAGLQWRYAGGGKPCLYIVTGLKKE